MFFVAQSSYAPTREWCCLSVDVHGAQFFIEEIGVLMGSCSLERSSA